MKTLTTKIKALWVNAINNNMTLPEAIMIFALLMGFSFLMVHVLDQFLAKR